jgi:hypothetical protein
MLVPEYTASKSTVPRTGSEVMHVAWPAATFAPVHAEITEYAEPFVDTLKVTVPVFVGPPETVAVRFTLLPTTWLLGVVPARAVDVEVPEVTV